MDRVKIKSKAKEMIKGNIWNLIKPLLVVALVSAVLTFTFSAIFGVKTNTEQVQIELLDSVVAFLITPLTVGVLVYVLKFVRKEKYEIKDIFSKMYLLIPIWVASFVVGLVCSLGYVLLFVPGVILTLMFSQVDFLFADGTETIKEALTKSREMMDGYKKDYFVFILSFIGWLLLIVVTFGIAAIYVIPYMEVSTALYYEELKKVKSIK